MSDHITIRYLINNKSKELKLFSSFFIKNNIKKCKIIYSGNEYDLTERWKLNINDIKNSFFEIKLKFINDIDNMSYMFYRCPSLISLDNISKLNINKVTSMKCLFKECSLLKSLPDISNWDTSNVFSMCSLFEGCSSLTTLPDISKWNTHNVTDMSYMFKGCLSLKSLPDISKWNTNNNFVCLVNALLCKLYLTFLIGILLKLLT